MPPRPSGEQGRRGVAMVTVVMIMVMISDDEEVNGGCDMMAMVLMMVKNGKNKLRHDGGDDNITYEHKSE